MSLKRPHCTSGKSWGTCREAVWMSSTSSMHRKPRRKLGQPVKRTSCRMESWLRLQLSMQLMSNLPALLGAQVGMKWRTLRAASCVQMLQDSHC